MGTEIGACRERLAHAPGSISLGPSEELVCGASLGEHACRNAAQGRFALCTIPRRDAGCGPPPSNRSWPPPGSRSAQPVEQGLTVTLADGKLEGDMAGSSRRFLNVPYAKPPLGALRFKAPVPAEPWQGVRHETENVKGCPQLADQGAPASENEDCLYLN